MIPEDDLYVPVKKCAKGHVIPRNGDMIYENGKLVPCKRPQLVCAQCAIKASEGMKHVSARKPFHGGKKVEGQESFLDSIPALSIT